MAVTTFNHFPQVTDAFTTAISQVVRKTAFDIQAGAVSRAPVDTGFLRNSIYTVTRQERTYGHGNVTAPKGASLLAPVETPENDMTACIGVGASYGVYVELGTRYQPARPYLAPATDAARSGFEAAMRAIEAKLQEANR